jgi:hypothetical protein
MPDPDRRAHPRGPLDLPVDIVVRGATYPARSRDLGFEGLAVLVEAAFPIEPSERIRFGIDLRYLESMPMRLEGSAIVLRVDERPDGLLVAFRPEWVGTTPRNPIRPPSLELATRGSPCD